MSGLESNEPKPLILWIHPGGLLPVSGGGAARTWALIAYLRARGFRVDLVTGNQGVQNSELEQRVDRLWIQNREPNSDAPREWKTRAAIALKRVWRRVDPELRLVHQINVRLGRPVAAVETQLLERNRRRALEQYVGEVAYALQPAAAIATYVWLAPALDRMPPGTLRIIDTIDIQHERQSVARAAGGDLPHAACTREEEIRELNRADLLLGIQPEEAATLAALCPDREVVCVAHALEVAAFAPSPAASRELLYVGNLYDPNILGLKTILADVWPRVRAQCPGATLTICGRVGESLWGLPAGVTRAGRVPDLTPYYARAAVVLNPVPYGTGLKIKTVEALAHGRCVVCSKAGAGGLGDPASLPLIVADPQGDMADRIVAVLEDVALRHDYEQLAWRYAQERFSPDAVYGPLAARLREHIARR